MNLIEALKTGLPLRRPISKHLGSYGNGWLGSEFIMMILVERLPSYGASYMFTVDREDLLADDWEVADE